MDPSKAILFQILYVWTDPYQKQRNGTFAHQPFGYIDRSDEEDYFNSLCVDKLEVICKLWLNLVIRHTHCLFMLDIFHYLTPLIKTAFMRSEFLICIQ